MIEKLSNKVVAVGGAVAVVAAIITIFGFKLVTPTDTITEHITRSQQLHVEVQSKIDSTVKQVEHIEHIEQLLEAILRGECLENPRENLARQGLLQKCKELGINR